MQSQEVGPRRKRRYRKLLVWSALILVPPFAKIVYDQWTRPLFHNHYTAPFFWRVTPPSLDSEWNFAVADTRLNLLLIVRVPSSSSAEKESHLLWHTLMTQSDHKRVLLKYASVPRAIEIPRAENKLFVVCPNHPVLMASLQSGEASTLYNLSRCGVRTSLLDKLERSIGNDREELRATFRLARAMEWDPKPKSPPDE